MTRPDLHTIAHFLFAIVVGLGLFFLVGFTSSLGSARADELSWFWLAVGSVLVCGRLVYLTWCRFWRREKAGYNGVARRLTLGYLRMYGLLGLASLFGAAVGFMTIITPNGGADPVTPLEAWGLTTGRVVNVPLLLALMACVATLIVWSAIEEERLRIYFEHNDKETHP